MQDVILRLEPIQTMDEFRARQEADLELFVWTALRRNHWSIRATAIELCIGYRHLHTMVTGDRFPAMRRAWASRRQPAGRPRNAVS